MVIRNDGPKVDQTINTGKNVNVTPEADESSETVASPKNESPQREKGAGDLPGAAITNPSSGGKTAKPGNPEKADPSSKKTDPEVIKGEISEKEWSRFGDSLGKIFAEADDFDPQAMMERKLEFQKEEIEIQEKNEKSMLNLSKMIAADQLNIPPEKAEKMSASEIEAVGRSIQLASPEGRGPGDNYPGKGLTKQEMRFEQNSLGRKMELRDIARQEVELKGSSTAKETLPAPSNQAPSESEQKELEGAYRKAIEGQKEEIERNMRLEIEKNKIKILGSGADLSKSA